MNQMRTISIILIVSLMSPFVSAQAEPEVPSWELGWITDMEQPLEFETTNPSQADEIWVMMDFYVDNGRLTPLSLELTFEWDEDNSLELDYPETIDVAETSNTSFRIDIRSRDTKLIESLSPDSPLSFSYTAQEVINGQAVMGQNQQIEGSVVMTSLFELALNAKWVNPVNAGSWSNSTIEIVNAGNSDDAAKESSIEISGCPQLSISGEGGATGVVIEPAGTHTFDLKIEASSSHPEKQCTVELSIKSEGDGETSSLAFYVSVKHSKGDDGTDEKPPIDDDEEQENDLESESSSLPGFTISEILLVLILLAFLRNE